MKKLFFVGSFLSLLCLVRFAQTEQLTLGPLSVLAPSLISDKECEGYDAPLADDAEITFKKLATFVSCNGFTRIDQVLKNLPARLRERYMLVYHSHSRHKDASFDEPRIILEDEAAKVIIASAGNPAQINGDNLEIIENGTDGSDSRFHVIIFPEKTNGPVQYTQENPPLCTQCHRQHLSPNWDSYPMWPGVYGSDGASGPGEEQHFKTFIDKLNQEKLLTPNSSKVKRYAALTDLMNGKIGMSELAYRNHVFSSDIGYFNQTRIMKVLSQHPLYQKLQPAMIAASKSCENLQSYFPQGMRTKFPVSLQTYTAAIKRDTDAHTDAELKTISDETQGYYSRPEGFDFFFDVKPFIGVGYIMKYVMGINPDDYSVTDRASVYNSEHSLGGIAVPLEFGYNGNNDNCEELKNASLENLKDAN